MRSGLSQPPTLRSAFLPWLLPRRLPPQLLPSWRRMAGSRPRLPLRIRLHLPLIRSQLLENGPVSSPGRFLLCARHMDRSIFSAS
jgi:hypothetical protein